MTRFIITIFVVSIFFWSQSHAFCGGPKLNADLARAAVKGTEFIRSKLADKNTETLGYIRAAAFYSLRLNGFTIDMLSKLEVEKIGEYIDKEGLNNITTGRLAYIVLGVKALCKDPRAYHGYNLIKAVEDGIKKYPVVGFNHPFQYALSVLSLCTSGYGQASYETYTKMLTKMILKNQNSLHAGDTISMATMALTCIYERQRQLRRLDCRYVYWYRRAADRKLCRFRSKLRWIIWYATRWLRRQQKSDGSFGNSITSALTVQALLSAHVSPWYWRCDKTMKYILGEQADQGYFNSPYVASTMQVTPSLIGAIPSDLNHIKCPKNSSNGNVYPIQVCTGLEFLTTPTNGSAPPNPSQVNLTVANGTNTYTILTLAATKNPCYKFKAKMSAFGHFITAICEVTQEPANKKYWLIYSRKPGMKDTPTPTGVDSYRPKDGECVIFKFQKLNFR